MGLAPKLDDELGRLAAAVGIELRDDPTALVIRSARPGGCSDW